MLPSLSLELLSLSESDSELVSDSLELLLLTPLLESPEARALDCGTTRLPAPHTAHRVAGAGEGREGNRNINIKTPHKRTMLF